MSIARKLKSILLTYSFVISISINLFTTGSEAAGGPPPPPPPLPPTGWTSQATSSNNTGSGGQTTQPESSKSTSSSKKTSSPTKTPEVAPPTTDLGKRYAKLIDINDRKQNLIIQFPKVIAYLIRQELTLQNLDTSTDVNKIITLFNEREDSILNNAKKNIYQEFIKDPYIAQFTNKHQQTGGFLDNKLFDESQEEATLRLLSLEQLDAQRKQEILSQQGNILEQLKFINENSEILGAYGKTASTDISKKLPKELPKILSQRGDILGQLRFIKENSEILGAYGKTASTDISKKLPKELPKILRQQGNILGQLKFINENSEILGEHSKATLKDTLKLLSQQLDKISSNQLLGFILDENKINTNLKNFPFSKKEVRELIDSLNNKILEKIFLQDDTKITEQDLTKILQKYKETDLIKNLTKAIVYINGNTNNEALNKTLEKGLENTTLKQRELFLNVLTDNTNTRIRKVLIKKIEIEQKQLENQKLKKSTEFDPLLDGLKKVLAQRKSTNQETIEEQLARKKQGKAKNLNMWNSVRQNMNNLNSQNYNQDVQDKNNQKWEEDNQDAQYENNNDVDEITEANQELVQAVNAATGKFNEMRRLIKDNTIKNATSCQGYLKGAEDQLTLAKEKGQELMENSIQAFTIIPKKYQDNMDENWQNYLSPEEITKLNALKTETNVLGSKKNKQGQFPSKAAASEFRAKQKELQTLSESLRQDVVTKQRKQLVQKYVDEMVTNAQKTVGKIETTLDDLKKKEKNKHDNAEYISIISKEILEAQERLNKAEKTLQNIKFKFEIAKHRQVNSSCDDSDDDGDDDSDKKAAKRKQEIDNAEKAVEQAQKDLEDAQANDAERQRQEDLKRKQDEAERQRQEEQNRQDQELKRQEEQNRQDQERKRQEDLKRKQDEAERKRQEDLKRKQDEAERQRQEEQNRQDQERKRQEDLKRKQDEAERQRQEDLKRKQDEAERQRQEDLKRKQDEAERQRQEEQNRQDQERKRQEDLKRKQDEAERQRQEEQEAEEKALLNDMASMFKNAEDEAEQKAKEDAAKTKAEADRKAKKDEGYKADEEELEESNNKAEEELKKDMLLESENKAIDIPLETEEIVEQDDTVLKEQISNKTNETVALLEGVDRMTSVTNKYIYSNIFNNRLNVAAIGAGDEEASINRGVWISGLYGINKQGAWNNIPKYQGRTTGVTIGGDVEFINSHDVIGIAYSRLESQVKYNKKLGKTAINGHLLSIYGLKELIKGFSLHTITSYGHNYIKNKTTNINNIIGKYQNNNVSFETLLNYKYRTKHDLHFIPSIGFKYDYSRASNYKEYNVDIENLMIQKKSNQSFESSLGGKIVFKPIATGSNIVLTPSLHGNIERHFNNKNTKVNAKATFKGQTLQQTIILPKQPKLGYNIGSNILMSRKNINVLLEYNYYTHRKYQSHQGLIKLKVNL